MPPGYRRSPQRPVHRSTTTRSLRTVEQGVRQIIARTQTEKTRVAFLVDPYMPGVRRVMITFSDPSLGLRGMVATAAVRPGTGSTAKAAGAPVSVVVRRGQIEVVSL